jgi:fructose-1,6-bisphosphatase-3
MPLEELARNVYKNDPATHFHSRYEGMRDPVQVARMQKAAAVMQFKLEGQTTRRHPGWDMEHRNLLHRIDPAAGTVEVDGQTYPLNDHFFPTLNPSDPYALSPEEQRCVDRLTESFTRSARLWDHMRWCVENGKMWTVREECVIFHACVPVDDEGEPLELRIDGETVSGRRMYDAFDRIIRRAYRHGYTATQDDKDWFYYLWAGPRSPLFGKDRMTTFENDFIDDSATHAETKNPYFTKIHDAEFCREIAALFGVQTNALIVNGHVPVKVDEGEQPVKDGGNAVTIDGAFSEAYGDRGFTLVLSPETITLAEHHHFESIHEAITQDADIVPSVRTLRRYDRPKTFADTRAGESMRRRGEALLRLVKAYRSGALLEGG